MRARFVLLAACALAIAGVARAHEIGTLQVELTFRNNGTYEARILVHSASALAEEYERIRALPETQQRERIEAFRQKFGDETQLSFDGVRVRPEVVLQTPTSNVSSPGSTPPRATKPELEIRLHGEIPGGAREARWSSGLGYSTYALLLRNEDDAGPTTHWLAVGDESPAFELKTSASPQSRLATAALYLKLGFTHIVPYGLDHILFVLGLFLLSVRLRPILLQVTAFTVAHSITLALSMYGLVSLPSSVVEPAIALSITCVAIENVLTRELKPWRVALVFAFGLLHGLGFAGVLVELGLPRSQFVTALLAFNGGVELGQLTVIAGAYALVGVWFKDREWYRRRIVVPASLAIAVTGLCWTVQRVLPQ
jgi:hydrogenase/urease accessory protein HupE